MADAADLDARAIEAEAVLELALHRPVVALLLHVDEVDDDEAREVAQLELSRDLLGRLEVRPERRLLDRVLARRLAGVDVDGDESLGLVDDDIAARGKSHERAEHGVQLPLDLEAGEQRLGLGVLDDVLLVARHQHAHERARFLVGAVACHRDVVDLLGVEVADRALDEIAFLVDDRRRGRAQRQVANALPQPEQVLEVALDLRLAARSASRADDKAHAGRHLELGHDLAQPFPVGGIGDLAADAAAARGVGHQHRVAAGEREVSRQRGALVAALLLDHLHEDDLAALDDFLNLVDAPVAARTVRDFLFRIGGTYRLHVADVLGLGHLDDALVFDEAMGRRSIARLGCVRLMLVIGRGLGLWRLCRLGCHDDGLTDDRLGRGSFRYRLMGGIEIGAAVDGGRIRLGRLRARFGIYRRDSRLRARVDRVVMAARPAIGAMAAVVAILAVLLVMVFLAALGKSVVGLLLGLGLCFLGLGLFAQQRLPVGDGNLVVVGMDFVEGEEAVAVSAVVDERRLQGRLDAGDLGQIDVAAQKLARGRLPIEFLNAPVAQHHDPGFLRVRSVDKHPVLAVIRHVMWSLARLRPWREVDDRHSRP